MAKKREKVMALTRKRRTTRIVPPTFSYGPLARSVDIFHGARDAKTAVSDVALTTMPYYCRMVATFEENDRRHLARCEDRLRRPIADLRAGTTALLESDRKIARLMDEKRTVQTVKPQSGGELHLSQEALLARREAAVSKRVNQAVAERDAHFIACVQMRALVIEAFFLAQTESSRMRAYYERRLSTYARRLARGRARLDGLEVALPVPEWTQQACPWLPADLEVRLANEAVDSNLSQGAMWSWESQG